MGRKPSLFPGPASWHQGPWSRPIWLKHNSNRPLYPMWPPLPWQGSHSSPESVAIGTRTVTKARVEAGLGEVPAKEASEAALGEFSEEGVEVHPPPRRPVGWGMLWSGFQGACGLQNRPLDPALTYSQKPGNRPMGPASVCRLLGPEQEPSLPQLCPRVIPGGSPRPQ